MIARIRSELRTLRTLLDRFGASRRAWWSRHIVRDATPAESACIDCELCQALHCTDLSAATCQRRLGATEE
jgi:hypothetical protein